MGNIISEGLEYIGRIDDNGFVFNQSGDHVATINDSGYIIKAAGGSIGKIDEDGIIRDSRFDVVGRIQADGYVYIHSKRVCKVSSTFLERITPKAWNAGQDTTYSGRKNVQTDEDDDTSDSASYDFLYSPLFYIFVIGIALGIVMMACGHGLDSLGVGPLFVFLVYFINKIVKRK